MTRDPLLRPLRRLVAMVVCAVVTVSCGGEHEGPGEVTRQSLSARAVGQRMQRQFGSRLGGGSGKQILFGDLHVHSTFSMDAFALSLPLRGGEGAHPPADACDFARYCAGLDFFSINDHAENLTPQHWRETKQSIRDCNAVAADPANPDLVAFLGWEWTQVGTDPSNHYGHKNVVLLETAEEAVPMRPIAAIRPEFQRLPIPFWAKMVMPLMDFANRQRYRDFFHLLKEIEDVPACPDEADPATLSAECREGVRTPRELFERLDRLGGESMVIPHGTTWGLSTPPASSIDLQLGDQHDPSRQLLFEVYSGHGNAEESRDWRAVGVGDGAAACPQPRDDYEACCWRAGEIIRSRCERPGSAECEALVEEARANYIAAGVAGHRTVPGATVEDWLDCGQCRDCFMPAFDYRPGMSAQYALSRATTGPGGRFRFGLIASSDTHSARAGKGYKEIDRLRMTDFGLGSTFGTAWRGREEPSPQSRRVVLDQLPLDQRRYGERGVSFIVGGGLVAVHAADRSRGEIWRALKRKEVYGTSGPRILLWFDAETDEGVYPMGSEIDYQTSPRFRVAAVGSFEQAPGCPPEAASALSPQRLDRLCGTECYNPGGRRLKIERIEVVRIRPGADTPTDDPWLTHECADDPAGCVVEFDDPDYAENSRETVYYVRALQEPTQAINAAGLRCTYDANGKCVAVDPCYGDERTAADDDCLADTMERAWSSPIFVAPPA